MTQDPLKPPIVARDRGRTIGLVLLCFLLFLSLVALGPLMMLNNTLLRPEFVLAEIQKLDLADTIKDLTMRQLPPDDPYFAALDDTIDKLKPWLSEESTSAVKAVYDYLLGRTANFNLVISLDPVKQAALSALRKSMAESPPVELQGLSPEMKAKSIEQIEIQFISQLSIIPSTLDLGTMARTSGAITKLEQARRIVSNFRVYYGAAFVLIVFLVVAIISIGRRWKPVTRTLGVAFLASGVFDFGGYVILKKLASMQIVQSGLPATFQEWGNTVAADILAPLVILLSLSIIGGLGLIVFSVFYRRKQAAF